MKRLLSILLLAAALPAGCEEERHKPEDLIYEPLYKEILMEMFLAREMDELIGNKVSVDSLRMEIFDHYDVSVVRFERSHEYYERDPERQLLRLEQIRKMIQEEQEAIRQDRQQHMEQRQREEGEQTESDVPPAVDPADR